MKQLLFIGGAGFIGSNIIGYIVRSSSEYGLHVLEPPCANMSRLCGVNVKIHRGSLADVDFVQSVVTDNKIDIVIHLVSTIIPGSTYEDYKKEFANVIFPSIELMELCAKQGIKFIYFSSGGTIYGNRNGMKPFREDDYMAPISHYGWSKQMMENSILFKHRTAGLDYLIIRPSNPYGPGQNMYGRQGLVAVAIGKVLNGEPVEVWGDGSAIRDYIYITDLADIFCQLIYKDVRNETLNLGSGRGYSVNDVLAFLKIASKVDFKILYRNPRPVDVSNVVLDIENLRRRVDIEFTPFMDGMRIFYGEEYKRSKSIK